MTWPVRGRAFLWVGGWNGCCGASVRGSFAGVHLQCSWRSAHRHWPCFSCRRRCVCPTKSPSSSARATTPVRLSSGWRRIELLIACWSCSGYHLFPQEQSIYSCPLRSSSSVSPSNLPPPSISRSWTSVLTSVALPHYPKRSPWFRSSRLHWKNLWVSPPIAMRILRPAGQSWPMRASPSFCVVGQGRGQGREQAVTYFNYVVIQRYSSSFPSLGGLPAWSSPIFVGSFPFPSPPAPCGRALPSWSSTATSCGYWARAALVFWSCASQTVWRGRVRVARGGRPLGRIIWVRVVKLLGVDGGAFVGPWAKEDSFVVVDAVCVRVGLLAYIFYLEPTITI